MHPRPGKIRPLFSSAATTAYRVALGLCALLITLSGVTTYAYFHANYWNRIGFAPNQPIQFSHRHHAAELHIDCRNCHATVETSAFAGMPSTQTCLTCHSQIFARTTMLRPLVESRDRDVPLRWAFVNRLPAHVFFDHSIHIAKGVACSSCHGDVGKTVLMAKAEPLTMRWCLDCHKNPAPRLSPPESIYAAVASPRSSDDLMTYYRVRTDALTDCATCHH